MTVYLRTLFIILLSANVVLAQPSRKLIEIHVTPESESWIYETGDRADFVVQIFKDGQALQDAEFSYEIGPEKMPAESEGTAKLKNGSVVLKGIKLKDPGFVSCIVTFEYDGISYQSRGTAAYDPEKITPTAKMPSDFDEFWTNAKQELAELPIDARVTYMPELSTSDIDVYHVNMQNIGVGSWLGSSRFYGMLSVPKAPGKYPAILQVPGAGIRPYGRDDLAARGAIVFRVGIHGIPVDMENEVYQSLISGALFGYWTLNMQNRDQYYYKRVYLGCIRAIDYIFTHDKFDGQNLAVMGGSQGGALSIVTASLDSRVDYLASFFPALSDLTGYLEGRAGGWPHMFNEYNAGENPGWIKTAGYYDVVNFARTLSVPGWYSWGFNDNVCPPTSMYAAFNSITQPKELHLYKETGHWTFPEQRNAANDWVLDKIGAPRTIPSE